MQLPYDPKIALRGIYPREIKTYFLTKTYIKFNFKIFNCLLESMYKSRHRTKSLSSPLPCHHLSVHYIWNGM